MLIRVHYDERTDGDVAVSWRREVVGDAASAPGDGVQVHYHRYVVSARTWNTHFTELLVALKPEAFVAGLSFDARAAAFEAAGGWTRESRPRPRER